MKPVMPPVEQDTALTGQEYMMPNLPTGSPGPQSSFEACPKCRGQYLREGTVCHCYQCCFEWDIRDPVEQVLARARRRVQGERPRYFFWDERPSLE